MRTLSSILQRRSFVSRLGGAVTAFTAGLAGSSGVLRAQSTQRVWQPERHSQDDWLDMVPGKHRMVLDSTTPESFASALMFANNYFIGNKSGYSLQDSDLAVVIIARHFSTPFAFNDGIWKRYGMTISRLSKFTDPKTLTAPVHNVHLASGSLDSLIKKGVHLAVCEMATMQLAESIASDSGLDQEEVLKEIGNNLVANSHLVPAGIVAVNRAQERGYSFVNA